MPPRRRYGRRVDHPFINPELGLPDLEGPGVAGDSFRLCSQRWVEDVVSVLKSRENLDMLCEERNRDNKSILW